MNQSHELNLDILNFFLPPDITAAPLWAQCIISVFEFEFGTCRSGNAWMTERQRPSKRERERERGITGAETGERKAVSPCAYFDSILPVSVSTHTRIWTRSHFRGPRWGNQTSPLFVRNAGAELSPDALRQRLLCKNVQITVCLVKYLMKVRLTIHYN